MGISEKYDNIATGSDFGEPSGELLDVRVTSAPSAEPVTVSQVKDYLRVDHSADDSYIQRLIKRVRLKIEREYGVALITQTLEAKYGTPLPSAELPRYPFRSLESITEIETGSSETLSSSDFYVDDVRPPVLRAADGDSVSSESSTGEVVIVVKYKAGYGDGAGDVPEDYNEAILRWALDLYEHRGTVTDLDLEEVPSSVGDVIRTRKNWAI